MSDDDELSNAIAAQRGYLVRYAMFHLRDAAQAEDVVQDTLMAALAHRGQFAGRSQLRTWLTGILKHKIVDHVRRRERERPAGLDGGGDEEGPADAAGPFTAAGRWTEMPGTWGRPEEALESAQFWRVYDECCRIMPARLALVFSMREVMQMDSEEICKELGISASNLHVMLFRARIRLRACMTRNWFEARHG